MPVYSCARGCSRLISVSSIPGGNSVALEDPEGFAATYLMCAECKAKTCDRCAGHSPILRGDSSCPACQGTLSWQGVRPPSGWPEQEELSLGDLTPAEAVCLWLTHAYFFIKSVDGSMGPSDIARVQEAYERLKAPNVIERLGLQVVLSFAPKRQELGAAASRHLPLPLRVQVCKELNLIGILVEDTLDPEKLKRLAQLVPELGVTLQQVVSTDTSSAEPQAAAPSLPDLTQLSSDDKATLWLGLAFYRIASADGDLSREEFEAWQKCRHELGLPARKDLFTSANMKELLNRGTINELARDLALDRTSGERILWCKALLKIVQADGKLDPAELKVVLELVAGMKVDPASIGLAIRKSVPVEEQSTWLALAFFEIALVNRRLDRTDLEAYDTCVAQLELPCMIAKQGDAALYTKLAAGQRAQLGGAMKMLPKERQVGLGRALTRIASASGGLSLKRVRVVLDIVKTDLRITPEEAGIGS